MIFFETKEKEQIQLKVDAAIKPEELSYLFKKSGLKRPSDDLQRLKSMLHHADILITAWHHDKLVGIARAITDFSYCCYLSDLAVDLHYQKKGIGKELVREVQNQINGEVALILLASPAAMEYYPRIGFEKIENGYRIPRNK
ncbi:GNAT family N-acetyltransferase [Niallia sp. 03133]|uniref:GNAT family N-acetyltransferase n=1 Tax=Niallia sp. 03133 TaxID=3458060 RepID=UPI004044FEE5